jgi:hypothetical protein
MADLYSGLSQTTTFPYQVLIACVYQAGLGSIVPLGRAYFPLVPGASCLALEFGHLEVGFTGRLKDPRCETETGWKPILHCTGGVVARGAADTRERMLFLHVSLDTAETV